MSEAFSHAELPWHKTWVRGVREPWWLRTLHHGYVARQSRRPDNGLYGRSRTCLKHEDGFEPPTPRNPVALPS